MRKGEKNYITPQGLKKLQDEFDILFKVERPETTKLIAWAASNGDRSENADYLYGKKRLREIDKRLGFLGKRIESAVAVDPETIEGHKIQFGATVTVVNEDDNEKVYKIVGVDETDPSQGKISWKSPIGKALLGKEEGDSVTVATPVKIMELEIISICYLPM
ncbi:MAG: transcription elongation factor GreB [Bacteriovoracia bacterium]